MPKPSIHKDYKEAITIRFLTCMRQVLMVRMKGCRTMKDFADFVGEHQQNLSKMEKGERSPTLDQTARLCEIFGFSPAWVILGKGNMQETAELNAQLAILEKRITKVEVEIEQIIFKNQKNAVNKIVNK